jgi:transcriptional regulator with XRE-family HTH domain
MSEEKRGLTLGLLLKSLLEKHSLSMRKLSTLAGIDTATISRIVNGKQQAKLNHLKQFAYHLNIPLERLVKATGFDVGKQLEEFHSDIHYSVDTIQEVLGHSNLFDQQFTTDRVEQELDKYEQYAQTEEGHQIIYHDFKTKVEQVSGAGPFIEQLKQMHTEYCKDTTTIAKRAVLGSALLYFILSADIIPDYVFPIG